MTEERETYLELAHTEIDVVAQTFADSIFEGMAKELVARMESVADDFADPALTEEDAHNIVVPALKWRLYYHLSKKTTDAARGWSDVFHGNLNTRYDEGRGIET